MVGQPFEYDVFLSHNSLDKAEVTAVAERLREEFGLRCFLDSWNLVPGGDWQAGLQAGLQRSETAAVFFGRQGEGPWHGLEIRALLDRAARQRNEFRLIPVLLPGGDPNAVGLLLRQFSWVDLRTGLDDAEQFGLLVAGIKGVAPAQAAPPASSLSGEPYRGLERFEGEQADLFFGRDDDIRRLCRAVEAMPFTAVLGASGSGKSSLVRAGLRTRLAKVEHPKLAHAATITVLPGGEPLRALADQVAAAALPDSRRDERPARADGTKIVTVGVDDTARVWEAPNYFLLAGYLTALAVSDDGHYAAVGLRNGPDTEEIALWDLNSRREVQRFPVCRGRRVVDSSRVAFSTVGPRLLVCQEKGVALIDPATGRRVGELPGKGRFVAKLVIVSPDGTRAILCGVDWAQLWALDVQAEVTGPIAFPGVDPKLSSSDDSVVGAFSPSSKRCAIGSPAGDVQLWDAEAGKHLAPALQGKGAYELAFSDDGRLLAINEGGQVAVWDVPTEALLYRIKHTGARAMLARSGEGVLAILTDDELFMGQLSSGSPLRLPYQLDEEQRYPTTLTSSTDRRLLFLGIDFLDANTLLPVGPRPTRGRLGIVAYAKAPGLALVAPGRGEPRRIVHVRTTPPTVVDEFERVKLWVELQTGQSIDEGGLQQRLSFEEWLEKRKLLEERGGTPVVTHPAGS
jgi:hypothetical protein